MSQLQPTAFDNPRVINYGCNCATPSFGRLPFSQMLSLQINGRVLSLFGKADYEFIFGKTDVEDYLTRNNSRERLEGEFLREGSPYLPNPNDDAKWHYYVNGTEVKLSQQELARILRNID